MEMIEKKGQQNSYSVNDAIQSENFCCGIKKGIMAKILIGIIIITIVLVLVVLLAAKSINEEIKEEKNPISFEQLDINSLSNTKLGSFQSASIACDAPACADIGIEIFRRGGSVGDAAVASLLCMSVVHSHTSGLGGGFLMTFYNGTGKYAESLISRERAPSGASENMYHGEALKSKFGPLAIGIPGELRGYWEMYKKLGSGKIEWKDLFAPSIKICREGYTITKHAANAINRTRIVIMKDPTLTKIFVNPNTKEVYQEGDVVYRNDLADTLEKIANSQIGGDELYEGDLAKILVEDLAELGAIITLEDLKNFKPIWTDPIQVAIFDNLTLYSVPAPGSGVLLAYILKTMSLYKPNQEDLNENDDRDILTYHRIVEIFKHAYAMRTQLGDPFDNDFDKDFILELQKKLTSDDFAKITKSKINDSTTYNSFEYYGAEFSQPEDFGTAHISIMGPNQDAISITSTVNLYFGSGVISKRTGIILNNEMDDFSAPNITNYFGIPPSPNNFIRPGKAPLSSMCPSVIVDSEGKVRLVVGAAGGTKITSAVAQVIMKNLWFGQDIKTSIDSPRIHHQVFPMELGYEYGFLNKYVKGLEKLNHKTTMFKTGGSVVCAINSNGTIYASSDFRKQGSVAGF